MAVTVAYKSIPAISVLLFTTMALPYFALLCPRVLI